MEGKRKISTRRILQTLVTLLVTGACVTALVSAARMQDVKKLRGYSIVIKNDKYGFVDKEEVKELLAASSNTSVDQISIGKLNAHKMEEVVNANPWVAGSQVYVGNDNVVHINVVQRIPIARLFDQSGNSYYLDGTLKSLPLSDKYTQYTMVVTNVPVLNDDSLGNSMKAQIAAVVRKIERDTFWAAQVSQVMVTDDRTFELVPVLGNQRIILGDTANLDDKFSNLFAFYKKVLNRIGWDKYDILDARYAGQIVASPAIAWKVPVDKAVSNMNWVKSIIGNDQPDVLGDMNPTTPVKPLGTPVSVATTPKPVTPAPQPVAIKPVVQKPVVVSKPAVTKPAIKPAEHKQMPVVVKKAEKPAVKQDKIKPAAKPIKKEAPKKKENITDKKRTTAKQTNKEEEPKPKYLYQGH
ncbi:MAG: hypothetical protein BGO70_02690 [Bacteroidetes bacterium 43-93]|nr:hypothetical protein [Bacteroidota bacterium]OJW99203.1 MAG: hypothetical protein BGO70_02690 [Bacteroidetes bacterium 43-93]